jgi:hypothetical protein
VEPKDQGPDGGGDADGDDRGDPQTEGMASHRRWRPSAVSQPQATSNASAGCADRKYTARGDRATRKTTSMTATHPRHTTISGEATGQARVRTRKVPGKSRVHGKKPMASPATAWTAELHGRASSLATVSPRLSTYWAKSAAAREAGPSQARSTLAAAANVESKRPATSSASTPASDVNRRRRRSMPGR